MIALSPPQTYVGVLSEENREKAHEINGSAKDANVAHLAGGLRPMLPLAPLGDHHTQHRGKHTKPPRRTTETVSGAQAMQPHVTPSSTYLDARAMARSLSMDALDAGIASFRDVLDDPDADEYERFGAGERHRAFTEEMDCRRRIVRRNVGDHSLHPHQEWSDLARDVKQRVSVPDVLRLAGVDLHSAGHSRGRAEYAGPCPACGTGVDRLRCWDGPDGRLWCRRCNWSGDVIAAASLIVRSGQFRDCVRWLAEYAGISAPAHLSDRTPEPRGRLVIGSRP